jgi:hypothetical protein
MATLTARLEPATHRALKQAAASHRPKKFSVSRMAETLIKTGLQKPTEGADRNYSLACAVALLAKRVERDAKSNWRNDPFTAQALGHAVAFLMYFYTPTTDGELAIPPAVTEIASKHGEFAEMVRTPKGFGWLVGQLLVAEIQQAAASASGEPPTGWSLPIFFSERPEQLALIGQGLGAKRRKGKAT